MNKSSSFILHPSSFRRAFSIVEVMFAIMVLGIGFIMVAAMFPVAIQQSRMSVDEVAGRTVAESQSLFAGTLMRTVPNAEIAGMGTGTPPAYNRINSLPPTSRFINSSINSNSVYASDNRYACGLLYSCVPANRQMTLLAVAVRATAGGQAIPATASSGLPGYGWHATYDNVFIPCRVNFAVTPGSPVQITLTGSANDDQAREAALEGAVLIGQSGTYAGSVFYLANAINVTNGVWELDPKSDSVSGAPPGVNVYLVGRSLQDPTVAWNTSTNPRTGPNQFLSLHTLSLQLQ